MNQLYSNKNVLKIVCVLKKILVIVTKLELKVKKVLLYWVYFEHFFTPCNIFVKNAPLRAKYSQDT